MSLAVTFCVSEPKARQLHASRKLMLTAVFLWLPVFLSLLLRSSIKKFAFEFACEKEPKIMVGRETIARSVYHIQPIWSTSHAEARTRVIKLYKSWFREIPHIGRLSIRFRFVWFGFHFVF